MQKSVEIQAALFLWLSWGAKVSGTRVFPVRLEVGKGRKTTDLNKVSGSLKRLKYSSLPTLSAQISFFLDTIPSG